VTGGEIYVDRGTPFHRLDPRTKIAIMATIFVIVLYFQDPLWVAPLGLLVLVHAIASKSLGSLRPLRYVLLVLTVSSLVLWNLFTDGATKLVWFVERESLAYSISRTLVMLSLVVEGVVFLSTTRTEEITVGLIRIGLPYRAGFAISTAFRMVPMIAASAYTIAQAQRSRGLDLDRGGIIARVRKYTPLMIPVFASALRGVNTFSMALESKGFGAGRKRTYYLETRFRAADVVCIAALALLFAAATYLVFTGHGALPGLKRF
jgi:energy-coupling factor transport system permease protein